MLSSINEIVHDFDFLPGQVVADFGSGAGHSTMALARVVGRHGHVSAVDASESALAYLDKTARAEGHRNVSVVVGDVEKEFGTNLADRAFDGVVFINTLSSLSDMHGAVREARRILKPGGKCVVVESVSSLDPDKAQGIFNTSGLRKARSVSLGEEGYIIVFRN